MLPNNCQNDKTNNKDIVTYSRELKRPLIARKKNTLARSLVCIVTTESVLLSVALEMLANKRRVCSGRFLTTKSSSCHRFCSTAVLEMISSINSNRERQ